MTGSEFRFSAAKVLNLVSPSIPILQNVEGSENIFVPRVTTTRLYVMYEVYSYIHGSLICSMKTYE